MKVKVSEILNGITYLFDNSPRLIKFLFSFEQWQLVAEKIIKRKTMQFEHLECSC